MPEGAVSVCRPGRWGNPFREGETGWIPVDSSGVWSKEPHPPLTREQAVECFRFSAESTLREFPDHFAPLRGKDLACFCPLDQPCHADVLLELANPKCDECQGLGFLEDHDGRAIVYECPYCKGTGEQGEQL